MFEKKPDQILFKLEQAGFQAYYVGGCVRDTLFGRAVHDWDITTSALPEQIMACFAVHAPTGLQHGTVTVWEDGCCAEVTTFRRDGAYTDGRHPEQVEFVTQLQEDLVRRDFTVNALAMDLRGAVTDLFGGLQDLKKGVIRCIGQPAKRFREDALRMLRAVRFAAQLRFTIDPDTLRAIYDCSGLCVCLSAERVREELEKLLLSQQPELVGTMAALGLLRQLGISEDPGCGLLSDLPPDRLVRWAGFLRLFPGVDPNALRLDKKTALHAAAAAALPYGGSRLEWKRLISAYGEDICLTASILWNQTSVVQEILHSGECLHLRQLAVSGKDLGHLRGPEVGRCLQALLEHVLAHPEDNQRDTLLALSLHPF